MMSMKDLHKNFSVSQLGYVSDIVLVVALGLGLYTQWLYTENITILYIAIIGLLIFAISCALQYYFSYSGVGKALLHLWMGCILGILIFTDQKEIEYVTTQEVMDILLVTSMGMGWFWSLLSRFLRLVKSEPKIFSSDVILESLGLAAATIVTGKDWLSFCILLIAFEFNLIAIRFKSYLGLLCFCAFLAVSSFTIVHDMKIVVNIYGIACFLGRHSFDPVIDLYFSGLSILDRWQVIFSQSQLTRHLIVILLFLLNLVSGAFIGHSLTGHKEWFVVVPLFVIFAIIWICFHAIFFITCWKFMSKITKCNLTFSSLSDERKNMNRIMSSDGVRHFSLISQRLICFTFLTTVVLLGLGWETRTLTSISLIMTILPLEAMTLSLFWEMGDFLGGTATGYAIIAPVTGQRALSGATILSNGAVQDIGSRATITLNKMNQFFTYHMIDNYGCDFSMSGLTTEYMESKIKAFFDRRTSEGPRFDTYILYFSGDVYNSGDWALADNKSLTAETLIDWWSQKNNQSGTRLILILDTLHSYNWAKLIRRIPEQYVALQSCTYSKPKDLELGETALVGSFTQDFVHYSQGVELSMNWSNKDRQVKPVILSVQTLDGLYVLFADKRGHRESLEQQFP
ncbi:hypothetical protein FSP39_000115 [Pinctada imbricata]|uniref:Transmembrane protein 168 n=1 Tax=Pinctada imbricata TaxID=66713 RepID=A0AA88YJU4_PINIB|nr:hypothetical protein FSP39_000115 [Pinctada imbricata]